MAPLPTSTKKSLPRTSYILKTRQPVEPHTWSRAPNKRRQNYVATRESSTSQAKLVGVSLFRNQPALPNKKRGQNRRREKVALAFLLASLSSPQFPGHGKGKQKHGWLLHMRRTPSFSWVVSGFRSIRGLQATQDFARRPGSPSLRRRSFSDCDLDAAFCCQGSDLPFGEDPFRVMTPPMQTPGPALQ